MPNASTSVAPFTTANSRYPPQPGPCPVGERPVAVREVGDGHRHERGQALGRHGAETEVGVQQLDGTSITKRDAPTTPKVSSFTRRRAVSLIAPRRAPNRLTVARVRPEHAPRPGRAADGAEGSATSGHSTDAGGRHPARLPRRRPASGAAPGRGAAGTWTEAAGGGRRSSLAGPSVAAGGAGSAAGGPLRRPGPGGCSAGCGSIRPAGSCDGPTRTRTSTSGSSAGSARPRMVICSSPTW